MFSFFVKVHHLQNFAGSLTLSVRQTYLVCLVYTVNTTQYITHGLIQNISVKN